MAYRKRNTEEIKEESGNVTGFTEEPHNYLSESSDMQKPVPEKKQKEYDPHDLIKCRSVVQGRAVFKGAKSQMVYRWEGANDIVEIEYQDLRVARVSKHPFLMRGYFIIEDDELLDLPEWEEVKKKYGEMYSRKDLTAIFKIDNTQEMVKAIESLPDGVKAQMGNIAKGLMSNGSLDSISKINAIDKVLGTDLMLFVNKS